MGPVEKIEHASTLSAHRFRYYDFLMAATCVVIVCSNIIGAGKVAMIGGVSFGAGILFFPLSYVAGDVLTEVYGYARARRVIWAGFAAAAFAAGMAAFITWIPPAPDWNVDVGGISKQDAFALNFGQAADRRRFLFRYLGGRTRQFIRDGENENRLGRQASLAKDDRLDRGRAGRRHDSFLSARFRRLLVSGVVDESDGDELCSQSRMGSLFDACHLPHCRLSETR